MKINGDGENNSPGNNPDSGGSGPNNNSGSNPNNGASQNNPIVVADNDENNKNNRNERNKSRDVSFPVENGIEPKDQEYLYILEDQA